MVGCRNFGSRAGMAGLGVAALLLAGVWPVRAKAEPTAAATTGFNAYVGQVERRLGQQHQSQREFLAPDTVGRQNEARLRRGELVIEQLTPSQDVEWPGAMLHDWRGTAFAPGAKAADFERLMKDFGSYPQHYAPQVMAARLVRTTSPRRDAFEATMRVRQKHVITVVMDTTYDIDFGRLDAEHGYSNSRSTKITEISGAATSSERALGTSEEHGFLWRLNSYWSYEERDGGLYMQIESVSLTRSIPTGLGWAIGPFVKSVPRESLEFTLRSTCEALQRKH